MARKKLPIEYEPTPDLERIADACRSREMPIAHAVSMLYRSAKLSQEVIDSIAADALAGYQWDAIAARHGMAPRSLLRMLARGKDRREKIDDWCDRRRTLPGEATDEEVIAEIGEPPPEDDLLALYDSCARAHANSECALVDVIRTAAELGSTADAKWLLVNRFPNWREVKGARQNERADEPSTNSFDELNAKITAFASRVSALATASADE